MNITKETQWLTNFKVEDVTVSYVGSSEDDIPAILAEVFEMTGGTFDQMKDVDTALYNAISNKSNYITDIKFDKNDIEYHIHITRTTIKVVKSTPTISRVEFAEMIGRPWKNVARMLGSVQKIGVQVPPARQPIPIDLAREIKARIDLGGKAWLDQWKADLQAAEKKATFEMDKADVSFEKDTGTLTIAPKGLTAAEQAQFIAAATDLFKLGGIDVDVRLK